MKDKQKGILIGLGISAVGGYGIYYAYNLPCGIAANAAMGLTTQMTKLLCLAEGPQVTIILLVASAMLIGGISKIIQNL